MARDVVVIGGGIAGLASAWQAVERGHQVTVIERGTGPEHDGCSLGNAGYVCPSHLIPLASPGLLRTGLRLMWSRGGPFGIRWTANPAFWSWCLRFARSATRDHTTRCAPVLRQLGVASLAGYEAWEQAAGGAFTIHRHGLLNLCQTPAALESEASLVALCQEMDVPAEMLGPAELKAREPEVEFNALGAALFPGDCHVDPIAVVRWLRGALADRGVQFRWGHEVTGWRTDGQRVQAVQTRAGEGADASAGEQAGEVFVLAAGSWTGQLGRGLGLRLPLQAGRGHSFEQPPVALRSSVILTEARVALTPLPDRLRIGGNMELGGLDHRVDPRRIKGMKDAVDAFLPGLANRESSGPVWTGLRPCTPDGMPYLGRTRHYPNLLVAGGHAMIGMSLGAVTGQLIGELIDDETPSIPLELLQPERFG